MPAMCSAPGWPAVCSASWVDVVSASGLLATGLLHFRSNDHPWFGRLDRVLSSWSCLLLHPLARTSVCPCQVVNVPSGFTPWFGRYLTLVLPRSTHPLKKKVTKLDCAPVVLLCSAGLLLAFVLEFFGACGESGVLCRLLIRALRTLGS